jgi:DeoR/GlpR family transcriptional regulator of sugar metabolism
MDTEERHRLIAAIVGERRAASVAELAEATGVSEVTVRRDLDVLERRQVLRRRHGGAESILRRGQDPGLAQRGIEGVEGKARIAKAAAALIGDGESLLLDAGTTALALARELAAGGRRATVMPLSLPAASALAEAPGVDLILPGGALRKGEQAFAGPTAEAGVRALRVDTAVLVPCGFLPADGFTAYDLADASIKRAAAASAARTIVLCDAAKWGRLTLALIAPADLADILVTDHECTPDETAYFTDHGIEVVTA